MKKLDYVLELLKEQEMLLKEELDGFPEPIEFKDSMQKLKQVEYALNKLSIYDVSQRSEQLNKITKNQKNTQTQIKDNWLGYKVQDEV